MTTSIRNLEQILVAGEKAPGPDWQVRAIQSEQCLSFVAWNVSRREAIIVDPKTEDWSAYRQIAQELPDFLWLGIIDTHTHADHVSCGAGLAGELRAPYIMHSRSPSERVHFKISRAAALPAHSAPLEFLPTPGHTNDSMTVLWGPFLFGGDTILLGDTGRDDLPTGSPEDHFESVQLVKSRARPDHIVLPGHDHLGGRATSWATQLRDNPSLTQNREEFIQEAAEFDAPAPALLKKSLRENLK